MRKKGVTLAILWSLIVWGGCGKSEKDNPEVVDVVKNIRFEVLDHSFEKEKELPGSRSAIPKYLSSEQIYFGDGIEAEITVANAPKQELEEQPVTRSMANGYYTVLAYQDGILKGSLTGTVNNNIFVPTSTNSSLILPHGTYRFVCFNDKFSYAGNELSLARDKIGQAYIGITTAVIDQDPDQTVSFEMKHAGARIRIQIEAGMAIPKYVSATLTNAGGAPVPDLMTIDLTDMDQRNAGEAVINANCTFPEINTPNKEGGLFASTNNEFHYFVEGTRCDQLKITFQGGKIFGQSLTGKSLAFFSNAVFERNQSYIINVKFKKLFTYLFHDGTVGLLRDKGMRTPIGLVIDENNRVAMALRDADNGVACKWGTVRNSAKSKINEFVSDLQGEYWTWNAAGSEDGTTVKAEAADKSPAFYKAAHYDPGVVITGGNIGKWYLPGDIDWKSLCLNVGFGASSDIKPNSGTSLYYSSLVHGAFVDAGGETVIGASAPNMYWGSTDYEEGGRCYVMIRRDPTPMMFWKYQWGINDAYRVRAVVRY